MCLLQWSLQIVHLKKEKQRLTVELAAMAAEANAAVQERNDLLAMHQVRRVCMPWSHELLCSPALVTLPLCVSQGYHSQCRVHTAKPQEAYFTAHVLFNMMQGLGDPHQPMMPAQMAATMSLAGIDKDAVQVRIV
jgi:hypothetical protein